MNCLLRPLLQPLQHPAKCPCTRAGWESLPNICILKKHVECRQRRRQGEPPCLPPPPCLGLNSTAGFLRNNSKEAGEEREGRERNSILFKTVADQVEKIQSVDCILIPQPA